MAAVVDGEVQSDDAVAAELVGHRHGRTGGGSGIGDAVDPCVAVAGTLGENSLRDGINGECEQEQRVAAMRGLQGVGVETSDGE